MSTTLAIHMQVEWLAEGQLFLHVHSKRPRANLNFERLAFQLFAWDPWSFYGTMLTVVEHNEDLGLVLSARHGLHYFAKPSFNSEFAVTFHPEWAVLHGSAVEILEALRQGCFMPDLDAWRTGELKWKGTVGPSPHVRQAGDVVPFYADWLHQAIVETLSTTPAAAQAWDAVRQAYPLLDSATPESALLEEEAAWLAALDLRPDPTPFFVGLALVEPNRDRWGDIQETIAEPDNGSPQWRLQVVLQDKQELARVLPWRQKGTTVQGVSSLPLAWLPYLTGVDHALLQWQRLVPWLVEDALPAWPNAAALPDVPGVPGVAAAPQRTLKSELTERQAWEFLSDASARLVAAGVRVYLPDWWEEAHRLRARLKAKVKSSVGTTQQSLFGIDQIVQFDWAVAVGDTELTTEEFTRLLEERRPLVEIRGHWLVLDAAFYDRALKKVKQVGKSGGLSLRDVFTLHLSSGGHAEDGV
ncbi:hypothetical protein D2Q93_12915, partial [Alicyclobacillaceae bacterium I2511]